MTHVLLGGERKVVEQIGAFLDDWGMTHSRLGPDQDPARVPLLECDVVILGCGPDSAREAEPTGDARKGCAERFTRTAETFSEVAPLLVVGNPSDHQNGLAAVRAVVPDPGPRGENLRRVLQDCCGQALEVRSRRREAELVNNYAQFLGHELRSPLTAVKTALEVLAGDLGAGEWAEVEAKAAAQPDDRRLKMLQIALRNLDRLQRTVEWSQDLLELADAPPPASRRRLNLAEFLLELDIEIPLDITGDIEEIWLSTDPECLARLLAQTIRVMEFHQPEQDLLLRIQPTADNLAIRLTARDSDQAEGTAGCRTQLLDPALDADEIRAQELTRLVNFLVSGTLLEALGADLSVVAPGPGEIALILELPPCRGHSGVAPTGSSEPETVPAC